MIKTIKKWDFKEDKDNVIDLDKNKILSPKEQVLNIKIHANNLDKDNIYDYQFNIYDVDSMNMFIYTLKDGFIQFANFKNEYKRDQHTYITYKGYSGVYFSEPISLKSLKKYSKSINNYFSMTEEGKKIILENYNNIISNLSVKNETLKNLYLATKDKVLESSFFNHLPLLSEKENGELEWLIPNLSNRGEIIRMKFEGNIPFLSCSMESLLSKGNSFQILNLTTEGIEEISYKTINDPIQGENISVKFERLENSEDKFFFFHEKQSNTLDGYSENSLFNVDKINYSLIEGDYNKNQVIDFAKYTNTIIDIPRTEKLLKILNYDLNLEEVLNILNQITLGVDLDFKLKTIPNTLIPFISTTYRLKDNGEELITNIKINLFIPRNISFPNQNVSFKGYNKIESVEISSRDFDNMETVETLDKEILFLLEDKTNFKITVTPKKILLKSIFTIHNFINENNFTYKNLYFTNKKFSFPEREVEEFRKNKQINNFFISSTMFAEIKESINNLDLFSNSCIILDKNNTIKYIDLLKNKEIILTEDFKEESLLKQQILNSPSAKQISYISIHLEDKIFNVLSLHQSNIPNISFNYLRDKNEISYFTTIMNNNGMIKIPIVIPVNETPRLFSFQDLDKVDGPIIFKKNKENNIEISNISNKDNNKKEFSYMEKDSSVLIDSVIAENGENTFDICHNIEFANLNYFDIGIIEVDYKQYYDYLSQYNKKQIFDIFDYKKTFEMEDSKKENAVKEYEIFIETYNKYKQMFKSFEIPNLNISIKGDLTFETVKCICSTQIERTKLVKDKDNTHFQFSYVIKDETDNYFRNDQVIDFDIIKNNKLNKNFLFREASKSYEKGALIKMLKKSKSLDFIEGNPTLKGKELLCDNKNFTIFKENTLSNDYIDLTYDSSNSFKTIEFDRKRTLEIGDNSILKKGTTFSNNKECNSEIKFEINGDISVNLELKNISFKKQNDKKINFSF